MLFFIRQGWPELRAVLQRRFWVGLATHANLEYAVEAARMLDPDMRETVALRGGGTAQDERWRTLDTPSAGGAGEVQAPSCISAVCSFRSDDDVQGLPPTPGGTLPPGRPPTLVPKSFAAFRGVALATGAFVALDDCVGGMGHSIWDHADISRVLRPPQVSPSPLPLRHRVCPSRPTPQPPHAPRCRRSSGRLALQRTALRSHGRPTSCPRSTTLSSGLCRMSRCCSSAMRWRCARRSPPARCRRDSGGVFHCSNVHSPLKKTASQPVCIEDAVPDLLYCPE